MGIKGIYSELGPGKRVSLSKLASDNFKETQRPLRIAVDFAIWQFQAQAARGGVNPAIRTLFYRLVRLLSTPITPVFVFDGPNKPVFKRNKRSSRGDGIAISQAKHLIRLFGFIVHDAPGEAEAECALLQKNGVVDAVLSEDVDTIMFGCTRTLRNWSAEGKSSKSPTHVSLYDVNDFAVAGHGLNREGMVLVALMSGGDYIPEGIPGCGVKVAGEAAKAGFGETVCRLKASDKTGISSWRDSLTHELRTNESNFFRIRHKKLNIPEDFPNLEVLRYYTHPVVSPLAVVDGIREKLSRPARTVQVGQLREFTRETFGWDFRIGAIKFIRNLGPALLVNKMLHDQAEAVKNVKRISSRRKHFSADAEPELRISYVPEEVVPIDLSEEVDESIPQSRSGLALNSDEDFDAPTEGAGTLSAVKIFDITKPDSFWVLESVARQTLPDAVRQWEEAEQAKATRKSPARKKATSSGMPQGSISKFLHVTKKSKPAIDSASKVASTLQPKSRTVRGVSSSTRETSKQATPSSTDNKCTSSDDFWTLDSSPVTPPRRPIETIAISSSPAGPTTSLHPTPSPKPGSQSRDISRMLFADRAANSPAKTVRSTKAVAKGSSRGSGFKQTSMESFTIRRSTTSTADGLPSQTDGHDKNAVNVPKTSPEQASIPLHEDSDDDLPPLSTLGPEPPQSPSKRLKNESKTGEDYSQERPTKILLVPRISDIGLFKEVEVDSAEIVTKTAEEKARLERKGIRGKVLRRSDLSIIDLTQDDEK